MRKVSFMPPWKASFTFWCAPIRCGAPVFRVNTDAPGLRGLKLANILVARQGIPARVAEQPRRIYLGRLIIHLIGASCMNKRLDRRRFTASFGCVVLGGRRPLLSGCGKVPDTIKIGVASR